MMDQAGRGDGAKEDIPFSLAAGRRILYRHGCDSLVAGHLTARDPSGDGFWMTPFEYFDETTPDSVFRLGWDLVPLDEPGSASPAARFHSVIYQRRPDVGAIAHIHSHWVSVLVSTDQIVGTYNVGATLFHGEQRHYVDDGTRPSVDGERMADELGEASVLLMRNHGALLVAPTVAEVTILALMLERACEYHVACRAVGGQEIADAEARRVKAQYQEHFLPQMWQANLRRLRRSDPDLFTGAS